MKEEVLTLLPWFLALILFALLIVYHKIYECLKEDFQLQHSRYKEKSIEAKTLRKLLIELAMDQEIVHPQKFEEHLKSREQLHSVLDKNEESRFLAQLYEELQREIPLAVNVHQNSQD